MRTRQNPEWYQPGQLLFVGVDDIAGAADGTFSTTAGWYTVRNGDGSPNYLQLAAYTAPCDGYAILNAQIVMSSNTAGHIVDFRIYEATGGTQVVPSAITITTASRNTPILIRGRQALTGGTSYTWRVDLYLSNAGTLTVYKMYTFLWLECYAKP